MASSSTRSTWLENQLHWHCKQIYHRLQQANTPEECHFILQQFAGLLDISVSDLQGTMRPTLSGNNFEAYKREKKSLTELRAEIGKKSKSGNVYDAARCLADVGAELFKVGRAEEARSWCEWGDYLEGVAWSIYDDEQQWAKSHGLA
ncbi:hypothetical protein LTR85_011563 [Meristemomyces frigidus]|nr:hypothetical protein LTR85_011563 [Meristemomyces frigidus]